MNHIAQDKKYPYIKDLLFDAESSVVLHMKNKRSSVVTTDESAVKEQEIHRETKQRR